MLKRAGKRHDHRALDSCQEERTAPALADRIGGKTCAIDVSSVHPLAERVYEHAQPAALARRFKWENELPDLHTRALIHAGQRLILEDNERRDQNCPALG